MSVRTERKGVGVGELGECIKLISLCLCVSHLSEEMLYNLYTTVKYCSNLWISYAKAFNHKERESTSELSHP